MNSGRKWLPLFQNIKPTIRWVRIADVLIIVLRWMLFSLCSERVDSGTHWMPLGYAHQAPPIAGFRNGVVRVFSSDFGRTDYWPATTWKLSTSHGCQWMVAWQNLRLLAQKNRQKPDRQRKAERKAQPDDPCKRTPNFDGCSGCEYSRHKACRWYT